MFEKIQILTKVLYHQQRQEYANLELNPLKFKYMIEKANPQLRSFFNFMINLIISKEHFAHNINKVKKSIIGLCYIIADL